MKSLTETTKMGGKKNQTLAQKTPRKGHVQYELKREVGRSHGTTQIFYPSAHVCKWSEKGHIHCLRLKCILSTGKLVNNH